MAAQLIQVEDWTGEDTTIAEIEDALAGLRDIGDLRTSVITHTAWVPSEWLDAARETLAGLSERFPSRTIILVPRPGDPDGLDARVSLDRFRLPELERSVCSEVIEVHLRGGRAAAPASIVLPLLLPDVPAFLRWRGPLPFGSDVLDQLVGIVDRLVVDSREWGEGFGDVAGLFERTAVSDIAWTRTRRWRLSTARLWPGIAELKELRVAGPRNEAALLAGWLRSRLGRHVELVHEPAGEVEAVAVDGEDVPAPVEPPLSASELLSEELDRYSRDPVYEGAVRAAG